MVQAPRPVVEASHHETLRAYEVLDTLPEPVFERIVQRATRLFDMPMARITLIGLGGDEFTMSSPGMQSSAQIEGLERREDVRGKARGETVTRNSQR
jgi:hypothetical protein